MRKNLLIEEIGTKHLLIVPISKKYRKFIFEEFTSDVTTHMYPKPAKNIKETDEFIINSLRGLRKGDNLQMVILNAKTSEFLGCVGLHHLDKKTPELGVWLKKSAHGKAYGKEAIIAMKSWADKNLPYDYLLYPVVDKNIPSRKIPELLGAKIAREYNETNLSGIKHHLLEYRIYKK